MKNIFYFGKDPSFGLKIKEKFDGSYPDNNITLQSEHVDNLLLFDERGDSDKLLLIDLSPWDEKLLPEILYPLKILKTLEVINSNQVIILTGEEMGLQSEAALAANTLVKACFTKGEDEEIFFNFLCKELTLETTSELLFAKLQGIETEVPLKIPLLFNHIVGEKGYLETPVAPQYNELAIQGGIAASFRMDKITISEGKKIEDRFHFPFHFPLKKDFLNPEIGEIKESLWSKFLKRNRTNFKQKKGEIVLLGEGLAYERYAKIMDLESQANVHHLYPSEESLNELSSLRPDLIFLRVFDEANLKGEKESIEKGFTFSEIPRILESIKEIEFYNPALVILNSPSPSAALQNAFEYEKILGFPDELSVEFLLNLIDTYNSKGAPDFNLEEKIIIKENSPYAAAWQNTSCVLHTLSENLIQFSFKGQIVPGTWVHLSFPFELSILVLEERQSPINGEYNAYMGKVMGLFGLKERLLRVLINLAYEEPFEFFQYYIKHPKFLDSSLKKHITLQKDEDDGNEKEDTLD